MISLFLFWESGEAGVNFDALICTITDRPVSRPLSAGYEV